MRTLILSFRRCISFHESRGTAYGYLWVDYMIKRCASVEQSLDTLISNTSRLKMDTYHCTATNCRINNSHDEAAVIYLMAIVGLHRVYEYGEYHDHRILRQKAGIWCVICKCGMINKQLNLCTAVTGTDFTVGTIYACFDHWSAAQLCTFSCKT